MAPSHWDESHRVWFDASGEFRIVRRSPSEGLRRGSWSLLSRSGETLATTESFLAARSQVPRPSARKGRP